MSDDALMASISSSRELKLDLSHASDLAFAQGSEGHVEATRGTLMCIQRHVSRESFAHLVDE